MLTFMFFLTILHLSVTYEPVLKELSYNKNYTFQINNTVEYILEFSDENVMGKLDDVPPRIWIQSDSNTLAPLMIVARQTKEMLSWQLPLEVESDSGEVLFNYTSRTLCNDIFKNKESSGSVKIRHGNPIVSVSTASHLNYKFMVNVQYTEKFHIQHSKQYNFTISPSEPRYFYYNFTTNETLINGNSNYETVILEVNSDDDICMTVSIQNVTCPVFDTNQDVTFRGFYETVNKKGGITIPKYKFPHGFYIVFVAKADDFQCTRATGFSLENPDRIKHITFIIKPSITYSDYLTAVLFTLACIGGFYVLFGLSYFLCSVRNNIPRQMAYAPENFPPTPNSRQILKFQTLLNKYSKEVHKYCVL